MNKNKIRKAIAIDLRGKPSRNPESLIPDIARQLNIKNETVANEVFQMKDIGFITKIETASIRLSDVGDVFFFATKTQRFKSSLLRNWPHITSNLVALGALVISLLTYLSK